MTSFFTAAPRHAEKLARAPGFRDWRMLAHLDRTGPLVVPDVSEPYVPGR